MRMGRCYGCDRRRPLRKMAWTMGEPAHCAPSCGRALHRSEAKIVRWLLGEHDWAARGLYTGLTRAGWRETLQRHVAGGRP
jgi:hypothetical protein